MKFNKLVLTCAALTAVFGFSAQANAANLLVNGSFENPLNTAAQTQHFFQYTQPNQIPGWTIVGGTTVDIVDDGAPGAAFSWVADQGHQSLDLNGAGPGIISQGFATTVGQQYEVSFAIGDNAYQAGTSLGTLTVDGAANLLTEALSHAGSTPTVMWDHLSFIFTADSAFTTLTFTSLSPGSRGGLALDNISVSAVPEPSSIALLGLGGIAAAFGVYRRRRA